MRLRDCWRVTPDDAVLHVLPLFHIHGLSFAAQMTLLAGGRLLLEDGFHPDRTLAAAGRATVVMAVPTIYYRLLEHPGFREAARGLSGVRLFTCGSAPIRPESVTRTRRDSGRPVINRYGMTKAHVIASLPLDGPWPWGSVGLPLAGIEVEVVNAAGRRYRSARSAPCGARPEPVPRVLAKLRGHCEGVRGRLVRYGRPRLVRRRRLPDARRPQHRPDHHEWLQRLPAGGRAGSERVPGRARVGRVRDARSDPRGNCRGSGGAVRPGSWTRTVAEFLGTRLVDYQRPRVFVFVDELPRNAMGKVPAAELRKLVSLGR